MKEIPHLIAVGLTMFLIGCSSESSKPVGTEAEKNASLEADVAAIGNLYKQIVVGCNSGNAAGIAATFSDDALYISPNSPIKVGKEAIEEQYQAVFEGGDCEVTFIPEEIVVNGDWAWGRITFLISMTPKGGDKPPQRTGRSIDILQREADRSWKVVRHIFNFSDQ